MGKILPINIVESMFEQELKMRPSGSPDPRFIIYENTYDKDGTFVAGRSEINNFISSEKVGSFKKQVEDETNPYKKALIKFDAPYMFINKAMDSAGKPAYKIIVGFGLENTNDNEFTYRIETEEDQAYRTVLQEEGRERAIEEYERMDAEDEET